MPPIRNKRFQLSIWLLIAALLQICAASAAQRPNVGNVESNKFTNAISIVSASGTPYSETAELGPFGPGFGYNYFGQAVAAWKDDITGNIWLVSGADGDDSNKGAAYIFVRINGFWHQDARLAADDGAKGDDFGSSVAIGPGTVVVGAPEARGYQGAAYIFERNADGTWSKQGDTLRTGVSGFFGSSVALNGDTLAVSAPSFNGGSGYVFVYGRSGTTWTSSSDLSPPDAPSHASFGASLAIDSGRIIVGAPYDSSIAGQSDRGSAYVFSYDGATADWKFSQKLIAGLDGAAFDHLGESVALSGSTAAIGAYGSQTVHFYQYDPASGWNLKPTLQRPDSTAIGFGGGALVLAGSSLIVGAPYAGTSGVFPGAAYLYSGTPSSWTLQNTLVAKNGSDTDGFGYSVAQADDTILVGAPDADPDLDDRGALSVFKNIYGDWQEQSPLYAQSDENENFGYAVAISGNTALVRAISQSNALGEKGVVNVFVKNDDGNWTWQAEFPQTGYDEISYAAPYCNTVALDGDTAVLGSAYETVGSHTDQGAFYIYTRTGTAWTQQYAFSDPAGSTGDELGCSVALSGNTIIVGAPGANSYTGAGYVFTRSGSSWVQQALLKASDGAPDDSMGTSVAISSDSILLGAPNASSGVGASYLFTRSGTTWKQTKKFTSPDPASGDYFGATVALYFKYAFVGSPSRPCGMAPHCGRVYVYSGSAWGTETTIDSPDGGGGFGSALAIDGNRLVIGEMDGARAHVYAWEKSAWSLQSTFEGDAGSLVGAALAVSGSNVIVGAPYAEPKSGGRAYIVQDDRIFADGFD